MNINSIPSAIQSGVDGYKKAEQGVTDASLQISRANLERNPETSPQPNNQVSSEAPTPRVSLETEAVNLIVNQNLAQANVKTIKTADEMLGTLLDIKV